MNWKTISPRFIFITSAIVLAAVSRLMPHFPNFAPIAAMALFGGACYSNRTMAFLLPLLAMLLSDIFIGFHNTLVYVYAGFIVTTFIGIQLKNTKVHSIAIGSLLSSVLFFIITNFGVWAAGGGLNSGTGLVNTYVLGIPFFGATMLGDLFYNGILFGAFYLAQLKFPKLSRI